MALQSLAPMLQAAADGGYAVAQFNTDSIEIAQAVIRVGVETRAPLILAIGQGVDRAGRLEAVAAGLRQLAQAAPVPICLHLDHSEGLGQITRALCAGFSGVMFDGSARPLEENIELTRQTMAMCAELGVGVEAELGRIAGIEDDLVVSEDDAGKVSPETVRAFLKGVRPDALAVAVGTAHGFYTREPEIDFELIEHLRATDCPPLVLHGGTGLSDAVLRQAVGSGIAKINFATELRHAFVEAAGARASANGLLLDMLADGAQAAAQVAAAKIHITGSAGRA